MNVDDIDDLKREIDILKTLDHPNIVKYYEVYDDYKQIHFVMEFCKGGSLVEVLTEKLRRMKEEEAGVIFKKLF